MDANLPFEKFVPLEIKNMKQTKETSTMAQEPQNNPILAFKTEKLPSMKQKNFFNKL